MGEIILLLGTELLFLLFLMYMPALRGADAFFGVRVSQEFFSAKAARSCGVTGCIWRRFL